MESSNGWVRILGPQLFKDLQRGIPKAEKLRFRRELSNLEEAATLFLERWAEEEDSDGGAARSQAR